MKKIIFGVIALTICFLISKKEDFIIIPNEAIRIRVISNSNDIKDIAQKKQLKKHIDSYLYNLLENTTNIDEARGIINENILNVENILKNDNINKYSIKYGMNYFPKKTYKGILYPEGNYESLEIKLGEGLGENYWCVLFPPLCMINENEITSNASYQLYIKDWLKIDK